MRYKKKPVVIEAYQYNGDFKNAPEWIKNAFKSETLFWSISEIKENGKFCIFDFDTLYVKTLEGTHKVSMGDYIIKGVKGELYPCKPDIFELTYDAVVEQQDEEIIMSADDFNNIPRKTILQDLLEKYSDVDLKEYDIPDFCPDTMGYKLLKNFCNISCEWCWKSELEDE